MTVLSCVVESRIYICIGHRPQYSFGRTQIQRFGGHAGHIQLIPEYRMAVGGGPNSDIHISNFLIFLSPGGMVGAIRSSKTKGPRLEGIRNDKIVMREKGNGGYVKAEEGV